MTWYIDILHVFFGSEKQRLCTYLIFDKVESKEQAYVLFIIYPEYYIIFDWSCGYWLIYLSSKNIIWFFTTYYVHILLYTKYFKSLKICNLSGFD